MLGAGNIGESSFEASPDIDESEVRIVLILLDHFLGLFCVDTHGFCRETIIMGGNHNKNYIKYSN